MNTLLNEASSQDQLLKTLKNLTFTEISADDFKKQFPNNDELKDQSAHPIKNIWGLKMRANAWADSWVLSIDDKTNPYIAYIDGNKTEFSGALLVSSFLKKISEQLTEKLSKKQPAAVWIKDFIDSTNSRFKGKTKKERISMALGAYYAAQKNEAFNEHASSFKPNDDSIDYDLEQLAAGIKVEMEHTDDKEIATIIAKHHLAEDPEYYIKLVSCVEKGIKEAKIPSYKYDVVIAKLKDGIWDSSYDVKRGKHLEVTDNITKKTMTIFVEEYGAGFEGTDELRKKYIKDTPGQRIQQFKTEMKQYDYQEFEAQHKKMYPSHTTDQVKAAYKKYSKYQEETELEEAVLKVGDLVKVTVSDGTYNWSTGKTIRPEVTANGKITDISIEDKSVHAGDTAKRYTVKFKDPRTGKIETDKFFFVIPLSERPELEEAYGKLVKEDSMEEVVQDEIEILLNKWRETGRIAYRRPNKKLISLNGGPNMPEKQALEKIKDFFAKQKENAVQEAVSIRFIDDLLSAADKEQRKNKQLRQGQSIMIALKDMNSKLYSDVTGTEYDPFYNDKKIPALMKFLNPNWKFFELDEAININDYMATSEKSQFGGYRPHVVDKAGKTMYLSQASYNTPAEAKDHAEEYLKQYSRGVSEPRVPVKGTYGLKEEKENYDSWIIKPRDGGDGVKVKAPDETSAIEIALGRKPSQNEIDFFNFHYILIHEKTNVSTLRNMKIVELATKCYDSDLVKEYVEQHYKPKTSALEIKESFRSFVSNKTIV